MTSSNRIKTEIVRGTQKYAGSPARDLGLAVSLESEKKELIQGDRTVVLNLTERFNRERQDSTIYRLYGKCFLVFENSYIGFANTSNTTLYNTLLNNLYYTDNEGGLVTGLINNDPLVFSGYLPFNYFNILEEEQESDNQIQSVNWHIQLSYVSGQQTDKRLVWTYENPNVGTNDPLIWAASNGIPFYFYALQDSGKNIIRFVCPVEHGLSINESFTIINNSFMANGVSSLVNAQGIPTVDFEVFSLGDGSLNSDKYIFNIVDVEYVMPATNKAGTFRRIADIKNRAESESRYYIHEHTILTENTATFASGLVEPEIVVNRCAFEKEIFKRQQRYIRADMTPPPGAASDKVITKTAYPAYLYSFIKDIDVSQYRDNLYRPISELYVTINKNPLEPTTGGMLWTYPTTSYDWNYHHDYLDAWFSDWAYPSTNNTVGVDNSLGYTKIYPTEAPAGIDHGLDVGDTMAGAFVEYNKFDLKERIISEASHHIAANPLAFMHEVILDGFIQGDTTGGGVPVTNYPYTATDTLGIPHDQSIWQNIPLQINSNGTYAGASDYFYNLKGYRYLPHNKVQIRAYSTYIEEGDPRQVVNVPSYSTYFPSSKTWKWRDLLDIGYIETDTNGVDYSFLNNAHYPMNQINLKLRRQVSSDIDYVPLTAIQPIMSDDCE